MHNNTNITRRDFLDNLNYNARSEYDDRSHGILTSITQGDMNTLSPLLEEWYSSDQPFEENAYPDLSELDYYKLQMNRLVLGCRMAAYSGGLVDQSVHLLSNKFNLLTQKGQSIDFLNDKVFFTIFSEYCEAVHYLSTSNLSPKMKEIVIHINDNLTDSLKLKIIADQFDMHPVHLTRKFKNETGLTFVEYVNIQRINLAKCLFYQDCYSLSEVANLSGVNSHSYFTKVFKRVCGQTPTHFIISAIEVY